MLGVRATGRAQLAQLCWRHRRAVDLDALARFAARLDAAGLLGRRIERSPLPGGRHRWVRGGAVHGLEVEPVAIRPGALDDWFDARSQRPIDPEYGPCWTLAAVSLTDGGAAVTLVASHTVVDGLAFFGAVADAVVGALPPSPYPPARSVRRGEALRRDAVALVGSAPALAAAVRAGARLARGDRPDRPAPSVHRPPRSAAAPRPAARTARPITEYDDVVLVPAVSVLVDGAAWDACVARLGGSSVALFAAIAARAACRTGRVVDGIVTLSLPVSDRRVTSDGAGPVDDRGNALDAVDVATGPDGLTADLRGLRTAVREAISAHTAAPDLLAAVLPLTPLVPRRAASLLADVAFGYERLPVGCSWVGTLPGATARPDGADADATWPRLVEQGVRRRGLERVGGQLYLAGGRSGHRVFVSVVAWQVGAQNTRARLAGIVAATLAEFGLAAAADG